MYVKKRKPTSRFSCLQRLFKGIYSLWKTKQTAVKCGDLSELFSFYLQPLLSLLFALHGQHESIRPLVDNLQFVLLLLAVFGDVGDAAPRQSQLHLRGLVFGGLVTLAERINKGSWMAWHDVTTLSPTFTGCVKARLDGTGIWPPTSSLLSLMTQSSLVHWPKRFFLSRNAQIRESLTRSMDASSDGHWWRIFWSFPSSSSSS